MLRHTRHSLEQCDLRGVNPNKVLATCNGYWDYIEGTSASEVLVVIERLGRCVYGPDGSNGDTVVACIDPNRRTIKTVMFQRQRQFEYYAERRNAFYLGV